MHVLVGLVLLVCNSASQAASHDTQLIGRWLCELRAGISGGVIARWEEHLMADGSWSGQGSMTMQVGLSEIQNKFSGVGRWSATEQVFNSRLEDVELLFDGDEEVVKQLDTADMRSAFLAPSAETYELSAAGWVRRKSGDPNVTVCQQAGKSV